MPTSEIPGFRASRVIIERGPMRPDDGKLRGVHATLRGRAAPRRQWVRRERGAWSASAGEGTPVRGGRRGGDGRDDFHPMPRAASNAGGSIE